MLTILLGLGLLLLIISTLIVLKTISIIKHRRQIGVDLRRKNTYYKLVSNVFLKELPY